MKKLLRLVSGLLVLAVAAPAIAAVTDEDIDHARTEVNRLLEESAETGQAVIDAYGQQAALDAEIEKLEGSIDFARARITETEQRLERLAVQLYMGSSSGSSLSVLFSATNQEYPASIEYLREANGFDAGAVGELREFREQLENDTQRLGEALEEQEAVTAELEELASQLEEDLVKAQQVYDDLVEQQRREEEERRRREAERRRREAEERRRREEEERRQAEAEERRQAEAAAAAATSTSQPSNDDTSAEPEPEPAPAPDPPPDAACPVAGAVSFSDSWGAPRSGGRSHKGVDLIAARGTPIVAIYSGEISRFSTSSLGGNSIYFTSDAGDYFYYAHLDGYADVGVGQHVGAGTVIGYNGSSGNAPDYLPHLHFQYAPGGGSWVNPYPLVAGLC